MTHRISQILQRSGGLCTNSQSERTKERKNGEISKEWNVIRSSSVPSPFSRSSGNGSFPEREEEEGTQVKDEREVQNAKIPALQKVNQPIMGGGGEEEEPAHSIKSSAGQEERLALIRIMWPYDQG